MGEARAIDAGDRLPWLDTVEGKEPARGKTIAGRRLLLVLAVALFCLALFLVGRWSGMSTVLGGDSEAGPVAEVDLRKLPYPRLVEPEPVLRVDPPPFVKKRPAKEGPVDSEPESLAAANRRRQIIQLNSAWPNQRRYRWVAPDAAKPGHAIQLGSFANPRQANDEWIGLTERYPLLGSMAVTVESTATKKSEQAQFHLRVVAESADKAQLACQILRLDGRDCSVLR